MHGSPPPVKPPEVETDPLPEIRFEVNLPASWNSRFYMTGNGGYAGESLDAPQRAAGRARVLRRGFASAATGTGHDASVEPLGAFAQSRQKSSSTTLSARSTPPPKPLSES